MRAGHVAIIALRLLLLAVIAVVVAILLQDLVTDMRAGFSSPIGDSVGIGLLVCLLLLAGWISRWRWQYLAPAGIAMVALAATISLQDIYRHTSDTLCDKHIAADQPLPEGTPVKSTLADGTRVVACGDLPPDSIFTQG